MQKTIVSIKPGDGAGWRRWDGGNYGPAAFVDVVFSDGDEGSYSTKPDKAAEHVKLLTALIDKPSEFTLEQKAEFQGIPQWKIKEYPGKPQFQGGFGGGGGRPGMTKEEKDAREASILAQSSVKVAMDLLKSQSTKPGDFDLKDLEEMTIKVVALVKRVAGPGQEQPKLPDMMKAADLLEKAPADVDTAGYDEWQELYDEAVGLFGSAVRLQIATKKNPDELSVDELKELVAAAKE